MDGFLKSKQFDFKDILIYSITSDFLVALLNDSKQLDVFSKTKYSKDAPICRFKYTHELENEILIKMKRIKELKYNPNYITIQYLDGSTFDFASENKHIIEEVFKKQKLLEQKNSSSFKKRWIKNLSAVLAALTIYLVTNNNVESIETTTNSIPSVDNNEVNSSFNNINLNSNDYYITDLSVYNNRGKFCVTVGNKTYDMEEEDKLLFASIVAAEMGVYPYYSMDDALAICSVVLNRCEMENWIKLAGNRPIDHITHGGEYTRYEFEAYYRRMHLPFLESAHTGVWNNKNAPKEKFEFAYKALNDALNGVRNTLEFTEFHAPELTNWDSDNHPNPGANNYYTNPHDKRIIFGNPKTIPLKSDIIIGKNSEIYTFNANNEIIPISGNISKTK